VIRLKKDEQSAPRASRIRVTHIFLRACGCGARCGLSILREVGCRAPARKVRRREIPRAP